MKLILSFVFLLQLARLDCFVIETRRPHYIECQSSYECGSVACCVIGYARFSLPTCQPLLEIGETCLSMSYKPINTTVVYPDGAEVKLMGVHRQFCPCAAGLVCGHRSICYDPILSNNFNAIDSNMDMQLPKSANDRGRTSYMHRD